jgi:hypothetical protein
VENHSEKDNMSEEAFKSEAVSKPSLDSTDNAAEPRKAQTTHIAATAGTTGPQYSPNIALQIDPLNLSNIARNDGAFATTVVERPKEPTTTLETTVQNYKSSKDKKSTVTATASTGPSASSSAPATATTAAAAAASSAGEQRGRTKTRSRRRSSLIEDGSPEKVAAQKQRRTGQRVVGNAVENAASSGKTTAEPTNRRTTRSTAPLTLPVALTLEDDDPNLFSSMDDNVGDAKNDDLNDLARTLVMLKDYLWASVHKDVNITNTTAASSTTAANNSNNNSNSSNRIHMKSTTLKSNTLKFHRKVAKDAILRASKLVSTALQAGTWPSPYCTFGRSQSTNDTNDDATAVARTLTTTNSSSPASTNSPSVFVCNNEAHDAHMAKVADSIDLLTSEIIQPNVLQELKQAYDPTVHTDEKQLETRAFLGTLLLLREVLMQNKVEIFGPDPEECEDMPHASQRSMNDSSRRTRNRTARTGTAHWTPSSVMSRQILATTVILTALGEVDEDGQLSGDLCEAFLDLTETYEYVGWPRWRWCRKTFLQWASIVANTHA